MFTAILKISRCVRWGRPGNLLAKRGPLLPYGLSTSTVVTRCARESGTRKRREGQKGYKVGELSDSCRIGNVDSPSRPFSSPSSSFPGFSYATRRSRCSLVESVRFVLVLLFTATYLPVCTTLCEFHPLSSPAARCPDGSSVPAADVASVRLILPYHASGSTTLFKFFHHG